ncbi:iron-containing alcohol dehydrogenase [Marinilabilia salmonicolor]|uniref:iron-containing alcohol dehydrogenase n=1 Tax=Marinilabilia salmonicolor TaxID=989 RepID=UPI00029A7032|nr:iron-containing alcohol dehydrogenase [Marinilabilia salmonicolor]
MQNFNYHVPTKILFGKEKVTETAKEIKAYGSRVLLTYGGGSVKRIGLYDQVVKQLKENDLFFVELPGIQPNPRVTSVREGVKLCRENNIDFILAIGGGSVIDASKAIAAAVSYDGDAWDFPMQKARVENPLPLGTVLTLAATGSEMNGNAVITNEETQEKRGMGSPLLIPKFSVLDPTYTFSVNKYHTAAGTVDIMSHIFENYFAPGEGTFVQDTIAESILKTCIKYGPIALEEPENYEARANLLWAGSLALNGLTLTGKKTGDWATHGIEHEVSAIYDLTHGAGLAIIHPIWMQYVLNEETAPKFAQMARNVWDVEEVDDMKAAEKGINAVRAFFNSLGMPATLTDAQIPGDHFDDMGKKACIFGKIGSFRRLNADDVVAILNRAL